MMEKERRRTVFGDVTSSVCFHLNYDKYRGKYETKGDEELRSILSFAEKTAPFGVFLSEYLPSFFGSAEGNALVDLCEERGLMERVR